MSDYYTESNDITDYWDSRYRAWESDTPESVKRAVLSGKNDWFETRFKHILPQWEDLSGRVLDYGCGNSMFSPALLRRFRHYMGVDTSQTAIDIARQRFSGQKGWSAVKINRGDRLPYTDGLFDCVVTITVLQHQPIAERLNIIGDLKRVLRIGGMYVGLEMMGDTKAYDMPQMSEADWLAAWKPEVALIKDLPEDHKDWWADNVYFGVKA